MRLRTFELRHCFRTPAVHQLTVHHYKPVAAMKHALVALFGPSDLQASLACVTEVSSVCNVQMHSHSIAAQSSAVFLCCPAANGPVQHDSDARAGGCCICDDWMYQGMAMD